MIKISHGTAHTLSKLSDRNGYGYATHRMIDSLTRLGYSVTENDPSADVEIWFDQPHHWKFSEGVYKIGYHPWESTQLLKNQSPDWLEQMNKCDEIWTPSPIIADWYTKYMGVKPPVYVYEHGVDPIWMPVKREVTGKFEFLHVGGEAIRKGSKETMKALRFAFPRQQKDVSLTMKIATSGWSNIELPRIKTVMGSVEIDELVGMFHSHHAYVYPSFGEGFGLTPLQALATGMPTITLPAWAPYEKYLMPELQVDSNLVSSPFPGLHPGAMFQPDMDTLVESMRYVYNNYDEVQDWHHNQLESLTEHYSWDALTAKTFSALEKRL